ncbi:MULTISPECIES: non-hydrolyzing UDP-N-acetylglucosamine 2-epimerase [Glaesserella]|uniref:UDP-N-acetylglucosamine 2-epimerase n=1 Tax=Glaesserella australis TaxID=2094024 RepID=A0A328C525_9PAST|nr:MULTISPECIES: UDP-N-acetylglucosamine 2-epimerase (non-hydrolyzing) [Glaesserella]AUI65429.1 UDP-N-acetylglucosamine 2-epimerase (non-hydrolyzing) [Glaesserella sp. 15-184]RAL19624.1 UDP-N-acetylglucosamine 2-epimerase (non-hydrolyzing) [Glaesserella australis]
MKFLIVFGTRPEAIKMAPLIKEFQHRALDFKVCVTGQHRQVLDQVLDFFEIKPDYDLNIMGSQQTLSELTSHILIKIESVLESYQPDIILVHGDTATTFAISLAGYYHKINIAHIEAGLRTGNLYSPWPEEGNRKLTAVLANYHFAPTEYAKQNLLKENIESSHIYVTGNTVIDALSMTIRKLNSNTNIGKQLNRKFHYLNQKQFILITSHRRENLGESFEHICQAILCLAEKYSDVQFVFPVHLNPNVFEPVHRLLSNKPNIHLIEPQDYLSFIYLMDKSYFILTDSGGVQEEAPYLGKPVLVIRDVTERNEAVENKNIKLIGTSQAEIIKHVSLLLENIEEFSSMAKISHFYGNGQAAKAILDILQNLNKGDML